ncbi:PilN domain-containing protein [Acinetobacter sp. B5B]|uniref:PilN domain-containing protein n=1 Tax=Acinetobacter baretiae TaxID=2605383 RepID=UPI0018C1FF69|nr:PilN domain-containing protein [Acinetobacter baretiae]MBF7682213.1 PilN domain-containing protein [Acinetobacter baretiae]MBF7685040.1 PilN domain-containing protein [Acinetobacter baretiae]
MSKINLLPWRDDVREQKKKTFIFVSVLMACLGLSVVAVTWFALNERRADQESANQIILAKNQQIDTQLKSLTGLQEQRQAIIDRMVLIQNLQAQRPIPVRLADELVRVVPSQVYLTRFTRTGDALAFEGRADNPDTVAELIRNMDSSAWFRNVFMSSFIANDKDVAPNTQTSILPRVEEKYGAFVVTASMGSIAQPISAHGKSGGQ